MTTESQVAAGKEPAAEPRLEISGSRQLTNWMADNKVSLGFISFLSVQMLKICVQAGDKLWAFDRTFN